MSIPASLTDPRDAEFLPEQCDHGDWRACERMCKCGHICANHDNGGCLAACFCVVFEDAAIKEVEQCES